MYAIIEACGRQYKVQEGETVYFEKLDTEEGKKVTFQWSDTHEIRIDRHGVQQHPPYGL